MTAIEIAPDIHWVGAKDPDLKIFDLYVKTEHGTTYNSYLVKSDHIALIDAVKSGFEDQMLSSIREIIDPARIEYLIVNHNEPDHSGSLHKLLELNPELKLVCAKAAEPFLRNIVNDEARIITAVKPGDTLNLGGKTLEFLSAPMMHWPDTMFTYCREDQVLFSCDGYAAHFCPKDNASIFYEKDDPVIEHETWFYYDQIMRPFAPYSKRASQAVIDRDIKAVAPSHGPVNRADPKRFIRKYLEWTEPKHKSDKSEHALVSIVYASSYGYTAKMAETIAAALSEGEAEPKLFDATSADPQELRDYFESSDAVIFGTPTFAGDVVKPIWDAAHLLSTVSAVGKRAGVFGSYGWGGQANEILEGYLEKLKLKVYTPGARARLLPSEEELKTCREFGQGFLVFLKGKA